MTYQTRSKAQRQGYFLRSSVAKITKKPPSPAPTTARRRKRPSPAGSSQGSNRLSADQLLSKVSGEFDETRAPPKQEGECSRHTFSVDPVVKFMRILNELSFELDIPIKSYVRACEILACPNHAEIFLLLPDRLRRYWLSNLTEDSVGFAVSKRPI